MQLISVYSVENVSYDAFCVYKLRKYTPWLLCLKLGCVCTGGVTPALVTPKNLITPGVSPTFPVRKMTRLFCSYLLDKCIVKHIKAFYEISRLKK